MIKNIILSLISILFIPNVSYPTTVDYYDRIFLFSGVQKGIIYRDSKSTSTPFIFKGGIGYGIDDNKLINLNLTMDEDLKRLYINPEFGLLLSEFSRIKYVFTLGPDICIKEKFSTGLRSFDGIIFDFMNNLAMSIGIETRINLYDGIYLESVASILLVIKI